MPSSFCFPGPRAVVRSPPSSGGDQRPHLKKVFWKGCGGGPFVYQRSSSTFSFSSSASPTSLITFNAADIIFFRLRREKSSLGAEYLTEGEVIPSSQRKDVPHPEGVKRQRIPQMYLVIRIDIERMSYARRI